MNIIGEKVLLRAIEETDKEMFLNLINDPETEKMLGGSSFPVSAIEQEKWIKNQAGNKTNLRCVIAEKSKEELGLGTIILTDVDYKNGTAQAHIKMLKGEGRGKGFGTDALKTLVEYAFAELRLNCIYAEVLSYNNISQRLFEKCGFHRDGVLRARAYKDNGYNDVILYSILKTDER